MNELSAVVCEVKPNEPSKTLLDHSTLMKRYMSAENAADVRSREVDDFAGILKVLDPIVLKALEKDPADRFPHIEAFIESLNEVLKGKQLTATRSTIDQPAVTQNEIGQRSVAILPFRTIVFAPGVNTTDEHFLGVGLADALIARLGRINKFLVLPTSSIRSLREGTNDPIRTGRQLKVDYVLDGNIKLAGDRLRLSVQLLDVKGNAAIWATSIDEKTGDLFSLEETLSSQLIEALVPRISSSDLAHYLRRGTEEPDAFEDYIRGRYHFGLMTEEHLAKSFLLFHKAIAADPNYAHAYCGIANYYNWLGVIGVLPPADCFPPAIEAAKKAVELDPTLSEAHASLGFSMHVGIFDWEKPELHFKKAIELNPNNANACLWYSTFLFMAGRFETGFEYAYKAAELDRLSPYSHYNIGAGLYYARRFKEAEAQHQKVVDEFPDYGLGYYGLARIYRYLGKSDLAIETNNRAAELLDNSTLVQISTAESLAADGNLDETAEKLTELAELAKKRFVSPYMLSLVYSFLNDQEMVLNLLERSLELGEAWLCCAPVEARFESLFDSDRFQSILKAVNHPMTQPQKMLSSASQNTGSFSDRTTVLIDKVA
jgi:TolB-like protein/Tfp pilus assembly protein PilF